jgi:AraC family transcriptional regulator
MQTASSSRKLAVPTNLVTWKSSRQQHQPIPTTYRTNPDHAASNVASVTSLPRSPEHPKVRDHADFQGTLAMLRPIEQAVEVSPVGVVARRAVAGHGMGAEIIQATKSERLDVHFCAPVHLLIAGEQGVRRAGETSIEGLPPSTLRDLRRKLTFVPAGHAYHDWQEPHTLSRTIYFYFDPRKLRADPELHLPDLEFAPRLFFENAALWETALKLRMLIEDSRSDNRLYFEALGIVLAHELARLHAGPTQAAVAPIRGGLAAWQQRTVVEFLEEHLSDQVSLAQLAQLVRLSPYHFCRAFKQSFDVPPHRYHKGRRIERAKALLAKPELSVTDVALEVGFSETSSFTTAFRRLTGHTPTDYRRGLA